MTEALDRSGADDLSAFFDVSLDLLCIRDMKGRFVKANRSWETVLGYGPNELLGVPMMELIHPDDIGPSRAQMERADAENAVVGFVNRYRHRDGRYLHLEWRARRFGQWVFGVARDVTERLALQAEMQAAREAAEAANQAKSDFLANMSHEIRTPLNGVIGLVDALGRTALTDEQRELVDLVRGAGVTLERLVSDILDVSKIEAGQLGIEDRPFDLHEVLAPLIETWRVRAQDKGLAFDLAFDAAARGRFVGDSTRIVQIVGNLLSNAVKFTEEGRVRLGVEVDDGRNGAPASVTLEVEDTGVGFDAAAGAVLFQRFSQADGTITRRFGGTGLGLSICKALVEMMGGQIDASSEPGRGSLFRARIPMARAAASAESAPLIQSEPAALPAALRVLLAEDHLVNRKVVQLILAPMSAEVTVAADGEQAVSLFEQGTFDVVLMDMQMPVMDGLAATRALRRHEAETGRPATPVIMLSANAMPQHRQDAVDAGADLHLAKPVTAAALIGAVHQALHPAAQRDTGCLERPAQTG
jgi:PAS domain S-box-containing protein